MKIQHATLAPAVPACGCSEHPATSPSGTPKVSRPRPICYGGLRSVCALQYLISHIGEETVDTSKRCEVVPPPVNADSADEDGQPYFTGEQLFFSAKVCLSARTTPNGRARASPYLKPGHFAHPYTFGRIVQAGCRFRCPEWLEVLNLHNAFYCWNEPETFLTIWHRLSLPSQY